MELNIMFLARSTFIFDSWPYTKDENGTLHHRLMETTEDQTSTALCQNALENLVKNFGKFFICSPTQTRKQHESDSIITRFSQVDF